VANWEHAYLTLGFSGIEHHSVFLGSLCMILYYLAFWSWWKRNHYEKLFHDSRENYAKS
jgi:hypothetical protein